MSDIPVTAQELADLRTEMRGFIGRADEVLAAVATKDDVEAESEKRRRALIFIAVGAAVFFLFVGGVAGVFWHERQVNEQSVCNGFQAFTNELIHVTPPRTEAERASTQAKLDSLEVGFEQQTKSLGCDLHLAPVPAAPGG